MDTDRSEKDLINAAINTTLSRTINTSLATLLTIVILFFLGGSSIRGFSFALMVGIIIGNLFFHFCGHANFGRPFKSLKSKRVKHKKWNQ
ncbi:MAG: hypothetical protein IPI30_23735 [Saprospiraceae bacterium]|nr:hypothetical protein [Candidatus Vicinibacter affinis]